MGARFHLDEGPRIPGLDGTKDADPKWSMLFPFGTRYRKDFPDGKVELNRDFLGTLLSNFQKLKQRSKDPDGFALPVTYFHPDTDDDEVPVENKLAAGWILDLQLRDDGLYALEKWTDDGRSLILSDKVRYQSPEFAFNWTDSTTGKAQGPTLFGASLLNNPFLKDMPRVAASEEGAHHMAAKPTPPSFRSQAAAAMGLADDASDDAMMAAFTKMKKAADLYGTGRQSDKNPDGDPDQARKASEAAAKVLLVEQQNETLKAQVAEMRKRLDENDAKANKRAAVLLVDRLQGEGKIYAAQREKTLDIAEKLGVEYVENFYKDTPAVVPMGERGIAGEPSTGNDTLDSHRLKFDAKLAELQDKQRLSFRDALKVAQREMPEAAQVLFGDKANAHTPTIEN